MDAMRFARLFAENVGVPHAAAENAVRALEPAQYYAFAKAADLYSGPALRFAKARYYGRSANPMFVPKCDHGLEAFVQQLKA
jgi:hypothetical protein